MHWSSFAAALASASLALAVQEAQTPLTPAFVAGDAAAAAAPPYRDELLHLLKSLVSIPSSDPAEEQVGLFLEDYLSKEGYTVRLQELPLREAGAARRFNVAAWRSEPDSAKKVLVTSHIDVVPPQIDWEMEDGEITRDTVIRGRGTADAKGSIVAMLMAVKQLVASSHSQDVNLDDLMLLFVVGEETLGDGMSHFSKSLDGLSPRPEFGSVIFGEPTENKLACGHKGALFCKVEARGKAAHSGYPELGISANELMVRAWAQILDADLGSSASFGNTTVNIGRFDGGVAANVVPASAVVDFGCRVASGSEEEGHEEVQRRIQAILDRVDREAFTMDCSHGYGPYACDCDVEGFETMVANYGTDIPNLKGDHARYLYGPGSILVAHGDDEQVTVGDLEDAVEGFQKLIVHALRQ